MQAQATNMWVEMICHLYKTLDALTTGQLHHLEYIHVQITLRIWLVNNINPIGNRSRNHACTKV